MFYIKMLKLIVFQLAKECENVLNLSYGGGGGLYVATIFYLFFILLKISPPDQTLRPTCKFLILGIFYHFLKIFFTENLVPPPIFLSENNRKSKKIMHCVEFFLSGVCEDRAILWSFFTNYLSICKAHLRPPPLS